MTVEHFLLPIGLLDPREQKLGRGTDAGEAEAPRPCGEPPVYSGIRPSYGSHSRGGRPELSVLTSLLVSVDVKNY